MANDSAGQMAQKNLRLALLKGDAQAGNGSDAKRNRLGLLESGGLRKRLAAWSANRHKHVAK